MNRERRIREGAEMRHEAWKSTGWKGARVKKTRKRRSEGEKRVGMIITYDVGTTMTRIDRRERE